MTFHRARLLPAVFASIIALAACGGSAAAPSSAPASPSAATSAAAAKPSAAASSAASPKPAASAAASAKPAASGAASAKPAASGAASAAAKPAASGADTPEVPKVTVAFGSVSAAQLPLWVGAEQKIFQKYGLEVTPTNIQSAAGVEAVAAGQAQFFLGQATGAFQAEAEGQPLKIIAYTQQKNNLSLLVRPEITRASDLKGKPIAIAAKGDSTDLSVRIALTPMGIDVSKDVTLVPGGTSNTRVAALETGKVSAAALSEPFITQAKNDGMKVLVDMSNQAFISGGVTVEGGWASKNPKTVIAFLKGLEDGIHYVTDPKNKDVAIASLAKNLKADPTSDTVTGGYDQYGPNGALAHDIYPLPEGGDVMIIALKSMDPARFDKLTTAQVLDPQYMEHLRSSGFLKQLWGNDL